MAQTTIVTAASEKYADSLFTLIGSLNCNWPNHPQVVVYDIGLEEKSLIFLRKSNIEVRKVPPFCEHWRRHYTWKIWCINDIDTENVIYIDAGSCVLENLDEIIREIDLEGYFIVPNYEFLDWEASQEVCDGCDVEYSFRIGKGSIAANFMGYKKKGIIKNLLNDALTISMIEKNIMPTNIKHKQDQAIFSVLIYKYLKDPDFHDGFVYNGWQSPRMVKNQKVWVHRGTMLKKDKLAYKKRMLIPGERYLPKDPKADVNIFQNIQIQTISQAKRIGRRILNRIR